MSKFNPVLEDENYWKYQDLTESWIDFINRSLDIPITENLKISVHHLVKKMYDMGYQDACKDLNSLEELDEEGKVFN